MAPTRLHSLESSHLPSLFNTYAFPLSLYASLRDI
jgi:hypothetical protein